jgi:hypothetical protein
MPSPKLDLQSAKKHARHGLGAVIVMVGRIESLCPYVDCFLLIYAPWLFTLLRSLRRDSSPLPVGSVPPNSKPSLLEEG